MWLTRIHCRSHTALLLTAPCGRLSAPDWTRCHRAPVRGPRGVITDCWEIAYCRVSGWSDGLGLDLRPTPSGNCAGNAFIIAATRWTVRLVRQRKNRGEQETSGLARGSTGSSRTFAPPAWMRKCWTPSAKLGRKWPLPAVDPAALRDRMDLVP